MHTVQAFTTTVALCLAAAVPTRAQNCAPLGENAQARLTAYVAKKYSLRPELILKVEDAGTAVGSCYRKVRFFSADGPRFFELTALLAPDQTFLVTGVEDTRVDPTIERNRQAAERSARMKSGTPPSIGPADAPVKVVVFADFQCPYCKNATPVLKDAAEDKTHDVRVEFRNYPLDSHPWALKAALYAKCAIEQGAESFWKLHDFFYEHQAEITEDGLDASARALLSATRGFDLAQYTICLSNPETKTAVRADIDIGNAVGVDGTPSVYVNGRKFSGAITTEALREFIDAVKREQATVDPRIL